MPKRETPKRERPPSERGPQERESPQERAAGFVLKAASGFLGQLLEGGGPGCGRLPWRAPAPTDQISGVMGQSLYT